MRAYGELARAGFVRRSRYRGALLASMLTNTVFGLIRASLMLEAVRLAGGEVGGYDAAQAATYVWLSQALLGPLDVWGASVELGSRVRSGAIGVDFQRPISILGASLAQNYGRAAFELLPRGLPPLLVGAAVTGLHLPNALPAYLLGAVSLVVAAALCHCFYLAVSLSALWTVENRGFLVVAMVVQQVLCGFVVPVSWFPHWLRTLAHGSPFPAMFQTPVDMITERLTGADALWALGVQVLWLVVLVGLCQLVIERGRRRVVISGG